MTTITKHGTGITWTYIPGYKGETWNPVTGCAKVSDGCKHCYAETWSKRFWGDRPFTDVQCHEERLEIPLRWKKPRAIFVNSMSDLFHEDVPFAFIDQVLAVAALCPQHIFIVLTKRPERMVEYFKNLTPSDRLPDAAIDMDMGDETACGIANWINGFSLWAHAPYDNNPLDGTVQRWPLPNLWLGVSVENQKTADDRIPGLQKCSAAVSIISYEPSLGPVNLSPFLKSAPGRAWWVIAGGESGPGARPSHPDWFRKVRDDCQAAGVPFFFKQWGEWVATKAEHEFPMGHRLSGEPKYPNRWVSVDESINSPTPGNELIHVVRVGKKAAGDFLDGQQYHQFPDEVNPCSL